MTTNAADLEPGYELIRRIAYRTRTLNDTYRLAYLTFTMIVIEVQD